MASSLFFFLTLLLLSVISAVTPCPPSERAALLAFKAALIEPYLGIFNTWSGTDCCRSWYGVACDPTTGHVTDVSLRGESQDPMFQKLGRSGYMTGKISPEICNLSNLTTLVVADWKAVSGEIPACVASLYSLQILDLSGNRISGEISADIGNLRSLTLLSLADNEISGKIPTSVVKLIRLKHLDLSNNQLSGEIPYNFGNLAMLSRALLSGNQLTGSISKSVSKMKRLADLDVSSNRLTGSIPVELGKMRVLSTLKLDGNSMTGPVPSTLLSNTGSLSASKFMGHLDLSYNHLCGTIPIGSPFEHLDAASFSNNDCLCGNPLKAC
ncbi:DNA damage-repair/toleration protein [Glycine max]|nr:DNA damage-repair/toleration protein [Glycine max]